MTDAQLFVMLSGLKERLDRAVQDAEDALPDSLKEQRPSSELLARNPLPAVFRPTPVMAAPALDPLYELQQSLATDLELLERGIPDLRTKR